MNFSRIPWAAILCAAVTLAARADVTLPALISDNMVLQQRSKVNVWGHADPGETVTVQIGTEQAQATAGKDGKWGVKLAALKPGGPYDMTVSGKNSLTVHNVVVGDVWLCAGESNAEFTLLASQNGPAELADADLPMVREFKVKHTASEKPETDCAGTWVACSPATARDFSAVGYFFAKELNRGMHIPMGIVESAWGPSPAEAWTPHATLDKDPALHGVLDRYAKAAAAYPDAFSAYQAQLAAWKSSVKTTGSPPPRAPIAPLDPGQSREPAALYNGMIAPLLPYPIRGVLWYQGESNTGNPGLYRALFPALIDAWRKGWNAGDLPFLYVQLPGFLARHPQPSESNWAELREAQANALSVPKTGMAVTIDLGDEHNMHPADKQDVGHRLALLAESQVYGKSSVTASGPVFSTMEVDGNKAVLSFSHGGGLSFGTGGTPKGFAIAGSDRKFVWADEAEIHDGKVIVQSKDIPKPVAVRYAWANTPDWCLTNDSALPAAPFRTDNWVPGEASPAPAAPPTPPPKHPQQHTAPYVDLNSRPPCPANRAPGVKIIRPHRSHSGSLFAPVALCALCVIPQWPPRSSQPRNNPPHPCPKPHTAPPLPYTRPCCASGGNSTISNQYFSSVCKISTSASKVTGLTI